MKHKHINVLSYLVFGASLALSQTTSPITLNSSPTKAVGQPKLPPESANPNLVEGRELWGPQAVAFDTSTSPPIVYVSDVNNNRVLAWKNATSFTNGQAADLVIGQPDKYSTYTWGPGTQYTTGLSSPGGIAVSRNGDLYVADSNNNRVVRYPRPFAQTGQYPITDIYIGQPSNNSKLVNYPSGSTTSVNNTGLYSPSAVALDASGNLWVVDAGNRRVLEFAASALTAGATAPQAVLELGQADFTSLRTALSTSNSQSQFIADQFAQASQIAFDSQGRLYVSDYSFSRVLVFVPPFSNGQAAKRIMGLVSGSQLTAANVQDYSDKIAMAGAGGVFFLGDDSVGVVDIGSNRILMFPPYSQWSTDTSALYSPVATAVIGQAGSFHNRGGNGSTVSSSVMPTPPANASVFSNPFAAAFLSATNELFVADTGNNRVLVLPQSGTTFGNATRVLGQDKMNMSAPNLIEGREFDFLTATSSGVVVDGGIALDTTGSVPHLFVADAYNHRILGFYDVRKITPGGKADLVIGEPDFNTSLCNYPTGQSTQMTAQSLCYPRAVLTDPQGNLYVSDSGNGRVLRFPAPFGGCPNGPGSAGCSLPSLPSADVVLGQQSFTGIPLRDPSASNMSSPYGLAFTGANGLVVADDGDNRVLYIPFNNGKTFSTGIGPAATKVFGQQDFVTITSGSIANKMNSPHHIACDSSGHVYVTDTGNNRVLIFGDPNSSLTPSGTSPILTLTNLTTPRGIFVSQLTGEVWVTSGSTAVRYPKYDTLQLDTSSTGTVQAASNTLALAQDQYGDLFVADATSRVAVYYQGLVGVNGATFFSNQTVAPGAFASVCPKPSSSATALCDSGNLANTWSALSTAAFNGTYPIQTTLGDTQVLFNGTLAPLYYVSPTQINFIVPWNAPTTGTADIVVQQASTGQVFGAGSVLMNSVAPGIFNSGTGTTRQAAVLNQDFSYNTKDTPAARGSIIHLWGTGQGAVNNAPADGAAPPSSAPLATTVLTPRVAIGTAFVDDMGEKPLYGQWVTYSGLAPGIAGVWQIDVQVPMAVAPGQNFISIQYNGVGATDTTSPYHLYIWVK